MRIIRTSNTARKSWLIGNVDNWFVSTPVFTVLSIFYDALQGGCKCLYAYTATRTACTMERERRSESGSGRGAGERVGSLVGISNFTERGLTRPEGWRS